MAARLSIHRPTGREAETFTADCRGTYLIDVYDCANGCNPSDGDGDYNLTVTIN